MEAVFYDRKNKREVKASELMDIKLVQHLVACDDQELVPSERKIIHRSFRGKEVPEVINYGTFLKLRQSKEIDRFTEWSDLPSEKIVKYGFPVEQTLGEYGYKSEECPSYMNWDKHCMLTDLVFLRFE
jgi:hypothetical protein